MIDQADFVSAESDAVRSGRVKGHTLVCMYVCTHVSVHTHNTGNTHLTRMRGYALDLRMGLLILKAKMHS